MNENQVENLLSHHGEEILARRQVKTPRRKQVWKPVLASSMVVVAVGAFLLMPKYAEAAKIVRLKKAIKNARTVEVRMYSQVNDGPWTEFYHGITQPNAQKIDASIGKNAAFSIIKDAHQTMVNYDRLPFATIERTEPEFGQEMKEVTQDPLANAMKVLDGNSDPNAYTLKTSDGVPGTYIVDYRRADTKSNLHIIVDELTNLPIESLQDMEFDWGHQKTRSVYSYGKTYPALLMSFATNKKVYDMESERERIKADWSNVKSDSGVAPIYSASMTPDGTVWIAFGANDDTERISKSILSGLIAGSTKYIYAWDLPASFQSVNKDFLIAGKQPVFAAFVPLYDPAPINTKFQVQFGSREVQKPGDVTPEAPTKLLSVTSEKMALPEYMIGFGMQREFLRASITLCDLRGAIQAYEEEVKAFQGFVYYASYKPILREADCYEKLGEIDKAKELRKTAEELQKTRVR